tara:strand:+ start:245 stop:436 length:192 start_codon:yes stop_codon:yes gene_type:complete
MSEDTKAFPHVDAGDQFIITRVANGWTLHEVAQPSYMIPESQVWVFSTMPDLAEFMMDMKYED